MDINKTQLIEKEAFLQKKPGIVTTPVIAPVITPDRSKGHHEILDIFSGTG